MNPIFCNSESSFIFAEFLIKLYPVAPTLRLVKAISLLQNVIPMISPPTIIFHKVPNPTLASAITSAAMGSDSLTKWTVDFLMGIGNAQVLASNIINREVTCQLVPEYPLNRLKRRNGSVHECNINKHMIFVDDEWDDIVDKMKTSIRNKSFIPTPLIVFDFNNTEGTTGFSIGSLTEAIEIRDGAHRLESLLQLGKECYWTIVVSPKRKCIAGITY